jgi:hypothetical protein
MAALTRFPFKMKVGRIFPIYADLARIRGYSKIRHGVG